MQDTNYIQTLKNQPTAVNIRGNRMNRSFFNWNWMCYCQVYNALHSNDGQLVAAVADMNIFDSMDPREVGTQRERQTRRLV